MRSRELLRELLTERWATRVIELRESPSELFVLDGL